MDVINLGPFELLDKLSDARQGAIYRGYHPASAQTVRVYTLRRGCPPSHQDARDFHRRQRVAELLSEHSRGWPLLSAGMSCDTAYYGLAEPPGDLMAIQAVPQFIVSPSPGRPGSRFFSPQPARSPARDPVPQGSQRGAASPWTIRTWLSDLASVVDYAHQHGIVLGNLSPYTVWIGDDGAATWVDPGGQDSRDTGDGAGSMGSDRAGSRAAYLAPEQVLGWPVGPHADIYALGAILFWLLGGALPRSRHPDAASIGRFFPLSPLGKGVDRKLAAICERATSIRGSVRFPSADFMKAELLSSARDLDAAAARASSAARHTLIRGFEEIGGRQRRARNPAPFGLGRWFRDWF